MRRLTPWRARTPLSALFSAMLLLALTGLLGASSAVARSHDTVSVGGYDLGALVGFVDTVDAQVVAGAHDNNLVIRYVAGSDLRDGTLTLDLPRRNWPDPLRRNGDLLRGLVGERGSVVVRPLPGYENETDCRADPDAWSVTRSATRQRIRIEHLTCRPGDQITIRIWGVTAPRRPGNYRLPISVLDDTGPRRVREPRVRVVQVRTRLAVTLPARVPWNGRVTVVVKAVRPDGRIDRGYRGRVTVENADRAACSVDLAGERAPIHEFTAADAGVYSFTVGFFVSGRALARDVGREAWPGLSAPFVVTGIPDGDESLCVWPISFH